MNTKLPKVSIVICTLNCKDYLERALKSIRKQNYPKSKVEIVIVDSYSTDGTIETAKKYRARVILTKIRGYMEGKGMPKSIGCKRAKGDIIITIDSDNALVEDDWIRKMILPLMSDKKINFCICRMAIVKSDLLINQYLSIVGTDPFAVYCSIDPQISFGNIPLKDEGKYYSYTLSPDNFFIAGGYCLAFRRETLKKVGGYSRDVDTVFMLSKKGLANLGMPKNAHLHHLITKGMLEFIKKKVKWGKYYFAHGNEGRELEWSKGLFGKFGKVRFSYEVLRNLAVLPNFMVSLRMFIKTREKAWLLHAPMTFATTAAYVVAYLKSKR